MLSYKSKLWSGFSAKSQEEFTFGKKQGVYAGVTSLLMSEPLRSKSLLSKLLLSKPLPSKLVSNFLSKSQSMKLFKQLLLAATAMLCLSSIVGGAYAQDSAIDSTAVESAPPVSERGYRLTSDEDSKFNGYSGEFITDWRNADPDYEDTEFGELMYNEASAPTKLEILRLLSKNTPPIVVFLHAIAMGVDIEDVLQASIKYEPNKSPDLAASAVSLVPILQNASDYVYSGYELEDLDREESSPYSVAEVVEKFFKNRLVLRPYPDWFNGQYHFLASAAELQKLQKPQKEVRWYRTKSTVSVEKRPVFVSLYEATESVLIDSEDRITEALANDPNALLPVVFVFNRLNERPIDQLGYSPTIKGVQDAYSERSLMVTPAPEWQLGEYHTLAAIDEFYEVFDVPEQSDFEPEQWQKLLEEADDYSVNNTAFLVVVLGDEDDDNSKQNVARFAPNQFLPDQTLIAAWDDPRAASEFQYVQPKDSPPPSLKNLIGKGLVFNRPDLLAALNALGVKRVPVAYYYVDSSRIHPYVKGARGLINAANGVIVNPPGAGGGGGFTPCASPPCVDQ